MSIREVEPDIFSLKLTFVKIKPMTNRDIASGVVHKVPVDLRDALISDPKALIAWEGLTPLARNEWICWVIFVKKEETRKEHIKRTTSELKEGVRRPCCWLGCIHRTDKPISPSVRAILSKQHRLARKVA